MRKLLSKLVYTVDLPKTQKVALLVVFGRGNGDQVAVGRIRRFGEKCALKALEPWIPSPTTHGGDVPLPQPAKAWGFILWKQ